ncbi:MAG: hypothetical protein ACYC36_02395 [Bellilinea sp.]
MAILESSQSNTGASIVNRAQGHITTDAAAAVAQSIQLGFMPRKINFVNLTDRISDEWFENMALDNLQGVLRAICVLLDADATVADTNYTALYGTPMPVATNANNPPTAANVMVSLPGLVQSIAGLTAKLDADTGVTDTNYFSLWGKPAATQASLLAALTGIALKLDNDAGVTTTTYTSGCITGIISITQSLHTAANGTRTLELTNGISVNDDPTSAAYMSFTLTAATMVASKEFYWEAIG